MSENADRDERGDVRSWLDDLTKKEEQKLKELLRQRFPQRGDDRRPFGTKSGSARSAHEGVVRQGTPSLSRMRHPWLRSTAMPRRPLRRPARRLGVRGDASCSALRGVVTQSSLRHPTSPLRSILRTVDRLIRRANSAPHQVAERPGTGPPRWVTAFRRGDAGGSVSRASVGGDGHGETVTRGDLDQHPEVRGSG